MSVTVAVSDQSSADWFVGRSSPRTGRYRGRRRSWFRGWIREADPKGKQGGRGSAIRRMDVESESRSQETCRRWCTHAKAGRVHEDEVSQRGKTREVGGPGVPDELPSSNLGFEKA